MLDSRVNRRTVIKGSAAAGVAASVGSSRASAQEKTKIRLGTWAAEAEATELQAVLDKVNAEAEDFEIISEPQPADYYTKLQTTIAGSTAPDLFWLSQEFIARYASLGAIADITEALDASDAPAADLDDYFPAVLRTSMYEEKVYGLPWIAQPVMLYYNPKLLEAAGVEEPGDDFDWDAFKAAAEKITDADNEVWGTSFNSWPPIHMFMWQAGGETITEDLSECPIDTPESIAGADYYASIIYKPEYAVPETTIGEQGFGEMMKAGKVGFFYGGATDDLDVAYKKDPANAEIKMARVPQGPEGRPTFAWTASTVVNAKSEDVDLAAKALIALTEGIHHWKIVAPRVSLATVETISEVVPDKAESAEIIVSALEEMRGFNVIPEQPEWDILFSEEFQIPLFYDEGTAEELAPEVRPMLEDLLP
jgi:multiple sugar transport system substrate-binding protein